MKLVSVICHRLPNTPYYYKCFAQEAVNKISIVFTNSAKRAVIQSLLFVRKFATVFLVNTFCIGSVCVHKILWNFVEPIRDRKKIAQIKNLLRGQGHFRDLFLFVVGINTALRISDLLRLRIGDFLQGPGHIKPRYWIKEQKRGKRHEVVINNSIRDALEKYLTVYPGIADGDSNFVFFNSKMNCFKIRVF